MWVEGGDIQDELLDQLGAVLTAPEDLALTPSAAELEALAAAVAARWPGGTVSSGDTPGHLSPQSAPVHPLRRAGRPTLHRLGSSAWRAGSAAAAIVVFSASAAAAAAGGVPLPRPVRAVAYTVGLPVDSPALDDTNHHIKDLQEAVKANDKPKAEATARRLRTDLAKVPADEKKEAEQKVGAVMVQAAPLIQTPAPATAPAPLPSSSTTAPASGSSTTLTTEAAEEKAPVVTTTTVPPSTTTTAPEPTTTTTAPPADETPSDGSGTPSGDPGTGAGDPGSGGEDQGSTTPTTTPDGGTTTTTTGPAGGGTGGDDAGSTTTTTTTTSTTTTTTTPPPDPGRGPRP